MPKYTFNGPADADKYTTVTAPDEQIARRRAMRERWGDRAPSIPSDSGAGLWLVKVED